MEESKYQTSPKVDEMKIISNGEMCHACGQSGTGGRKENQDTFAGFPTDKFVILTVCDGMGGMAGGQTASYIAATEIIEKLRGTPENQMGPEAIRRAVERANEAIYQRASNEPSLRGMGTTTTVLVLTSYAAYLTHIGDSRIYQIRDNRKYFRTFDHSKVFEMVSQGLMTEEQARQSSFSNIITKALGIRPKIDVEVMTLPYRTGDRFILCCDGIWNTEPEAEMLKLFTFDKSPEITIKKLTDYVNSKGIERGGDYDNLTAIIADMRINSKYQYSIFHYVKSYAITFGKYIKSFLREPNSKKHNEKNSDWSSKRQ